MNKQNEPALAQTEQQPLIYINPMVVDELEGKRKASPGGLTWSRKACCSWTFPLYAAPIAQTNWNEFAGSVGELEQLRAEVESLRKDSARLDFMVAQRALIDSQNGTASPTVYRVCWPSESRQQDDWYPSERDAIDAAMSAKEA